jgi:hypothetical protein
MPNNKQPLIISLPLKDLWLDPRNPRLGRENTGETVAQPKILELMKGWALEELAVSFLENGFWPQEALIVIEEKIGNQARKIVVEGNRRLAALMLLEKAFDGKLTDKKWLEIVKGQKKPEDLFKNVPVFQIQDRKTVEAFLGYRHVSGIMEWNPAEKAEFIAHLIEKRNLTYKDVARRIGSKLPTVQKAYASYRLLLQMEGVESISVSHVEKRFSVLFLALRTQGVQKYLDVNLDEVAEKTSKPVKPSKLGKLGNFSRWVFGDDEHEKIIEDSRDIDRFGKVLLSAKAVSYLERNNNPVFETAWNLAGGDAPAVIELVERAADSLEQALSRAHQFAGSSELREAAERAATDALQLASIFSGLKEQVIKQAR